MSESTNFADKLKQTIDELELDRHVNDFVIQVENAVSSAREMVGTLAAEHSDDVERLLEKASTSIDERTDGRYAREVGKVREIVSSVVAKLAEYRPPSSPVALVEEIDEIEPPTTE